MTNFYQVREAHLSYLLPHGLDKKATNIHRNKKDAKAEAKKRGFASGSDIIMTRVLGHWDMVKVIQHLLNNPPSPSYHNTDGMLSVINLPAMGLEGWKDECNYPATKIFEAGQAQKVIGTL